MPLFHPRLVEKITDRPDPIPAEHLEILEVWANSIKDRSIEKQKETSLHGAFKEKIIEKVLGYKAFSDGSSHYNVHPEYGVGTGNVDLALGTFDPHDLKDGSICLAPMELKGAKTDLDAIMPGRNKTPVEQAWEYGMDAVGAQWVLVSNYKEIRLYAVGHGRQQYQAFELDKLTDPAHYVLFYTLLARENLLGGRTKALLEKSDEQDRDITNRLYKDYKDLRLSLIRALEKNNKGLDKTKAITFAQTILDRVLFIAFAEDKGLLPEHSLKKAYEHKDPYNPKPTWETFKSLFRAIDEGNSDLRIPRYNGGLFQKDDELEALTVSNEVCEGFKKLGEYDFDSEVSVTILGHIFEQSISDLEVMQAEAAGKEPPEDAKGKRKKEGVVYTPDSITRFIVDQTLGGYLDKRYQRLRDESTDKYYKSGKKEGEFRTVKAELEFLRDWQDILRHTKVVDPACGSGAFLVAAFSYLYEEYDKVNKRIAELRGGTGDIFDLDKEILNNNLYGVDINHESIEITKLSLWLKTAKRGKVLNELDHNLRVGDSLIEDSNYSYRAFTWKDAFPEVFEDGRDGFDVVLGNPPYVRQELIGHLKPYLEKRYAVYNGVADLYAYFFELGLRLLRSDKEGGRLGYISSATFFKTGSGKGLRKHLLENARLDTIVDFGDIQVFEGVTTYPAIMVMTKGKSDKEHRVKFLQLDTKPEQDISKEFEEASGEMPQEWLSEEEWNLEDEETYRVREKITSGHEVFEETYGEPLNGLKTALNAAFILSNEDYKKIVESDPSSVEVIEPYMNGRSLKKWHIENPFLWLVHFPKGWTIERTGECNEEEAWKYITEKFPAIAEWLSPFEKRAKKRSDQGDYWWELRANNYYKDFEKPKIIYPEISTHMKVSMDLDGFYPDMTCFTIITEDYFLYAYLNSNVVHFYLKGICTFIRGGYLRMKRQFISTIPIPEATTKERREIAELAKSAQKAAEERYSIQDRVRGRIGDLATEDWDGKLNKKLREWWLHDFKTFRKQAKRVFKQDIPVTERDGWEAYLDENCQKIEELSRKLETLENDLNQKVYALFDLTEDEIRLVEGTASI